MTAYYGKRERRVVPRWRPAQATILTPEGRPVDARLPPFNWSHEILEKLSYDWRITRKPFVATELVSVAYTLRAWNHAAVVDAAKFILAEARHVPTIAVNIAKEYLAGPVQKRDVQIDPSTLERTVVFNRIRDLKRRLVTEPRNAIARVDLARYYASIGQKNHAKSEMEIALTLARGHRFVSRAAARLYVHLDRPDDAHKIFKANPLTKYDPWLVAAEIAVAGVAGIPPVLAKTGKQLIDSKKFAPIETSELASALGTLELEHGKTKLARKLFQQALLDPTDNALAQAEWATERLGKDFDLHKYFSSPFTYEARSLEAYDSSEWGRALEQSRLWLADEPFSTRPAILGSFVAAVGLEQYEASVEMTRLGLKANPDDPVLTNNLVYALANSGDLDAAVKEYEQFAKLSPVGVSMVLFYATGGLLEFRRGNLDSGRNLYLKALEEAKKLNQQRIITSAAAFYAHEEARAKTKYAEGALERAEKLIKSERMPGVKVVLENARKMITSTSKTAPNKKRHVRNRGSAH